ncbi:thiamine-phosphate kinase [Antrihabitans cavernicola]|uniref:Thiamine-monophosphate kinase n=1 Tax=Antrihabitans cavernicola TaxID=2495913 RepID=A0A5A7SI14_9NOCA|nr:thiamine-phosphate kinase [Spelaeibacter cavernicola]KAA0024243.1 thiamine-phosphate kinase [Spelaeibacter cavernicola]
MDNGPAPRTVAELGEFGVIERITRDRRASPAESIGPGDDAAVLAAPDGRVVVTTDMLVQDRHFRLDWSDPDDIGHKAIAQNAADIAAMGARVTGFVVALACPPDTTLDFVDRLNKGMSDEAARADGAIVGGDLVQAPILVISITAMGDLGDRAPVLRSGARPGDVVAVAGTLGRSDAGWAALRAGRRDLTDVIDAHRAPRPPYAAGITAADRGATAMSDVSDSLLADLGHIATASGVAIDVALSALADPVLDAAARELEADARQWVLTGGEDHALAATFPPDVALPEGWTTIGRVEAGAGVTVDGAAWSGNSGWQSFTV